MSRRQRLAIIWIMLAILCVSISTVFYLLNSQEPESIRQARAAYTEKQYAQAFNQAATYLKKDPGNHEASLLMARAARRLKRDQIANDLYAKMSNLSSAEDLFLQADFFQRNQRPRDAEKFYLEANLADPSHTETLKTLTETFYRTNRPAEALFYASQWSKTEPDNALPAIWLGQLHQALNDAPSASAEFSRALQLNPLLTDSAMSPSSARKLLARNLLRQSKPGEALSALAEIPQTSPDRELLWLQSRAELQLGHRDQAIEKLNQSKAAAIDGSEIGLLEEPAAFTGAQSCRECHQEIVEDQQNSRHALTFHHGNEARNLTWTMLQKQDPHIENSSSEFQPQIESPKWVSKIQGEEYQPLVRFILGSGRHAITPILTDPSGDPREARWTYYASIHGWDITPGQPKNPKNKNDILGILQSPDMLRLCIGCHTTNAFSILNQKGPESVDRGIGCERCHGPAGNHIAAVKNQFPDKAIGRFRRNSSGSRPQAMQMCAECHGTQGREMAQETTAATVRFQSTTLTFSECYKKTEGTGGFDCLTCHSPHHNAESDSKFYDSKCLNCHLPSSKNPPDASPTKTCKVSPSKDCVSCHMPKVDSIQPHAKFTDHYIRNPGK